MRPMASLASETITITVGESVALIDGARRRLGGGAAGVALEARGTVDRERTIATGPEGRIGQSRGSSR